MTVISIVFSPAATEKIIPGLDIRPMKTADVPAMTGLMAGNVDSETHFKLPEFYRTSLHDSMVAVQDQKIVGFVLAKRCKDFFPHGIGLHHYAISLKQADQARFCLDRLIGALAEHCHNKGQSNLDIVTRKQDMLLNSVIGQYGAVKTSSIPSPDQDLSVEIRTINALKDKFSLSRPQGLTPLRRFQA